MKTILKRVTVIDEERLANLPRETIVFTLLFLGLVYLIDPTIGYKGLFVGLFVTVFNFVIMQAINYFRS